ncbi:conserved hypothetical protein [Culex quinquefasciatus]|uniref:Uncharacterized protein n=1 Tax=Culex quinquefasciatus TaxID=7176 RepID=B0X8U8_CULQU|nr:conserved hypothetical protein [Culex quinquefasciatus]|eukprot:XP_001866070.1 conserved hypothetical protein [Culex quinquefasciatus]
MPSPAFLRLTIVLLLYPSWAIGRDYQCIPYPVESRCEIEWIAHDRHEPITFPSGYQHFRIVSKDVLDRDVSLTRFDSAVYEAMHRPLSVEILFAELQQVVLPDQLILGGFANNQITDLVVDRNQNYTIKYLDLDVNKLTEIGNVSYLVQLETLRLEANQLDSLDGAAFTPLINLKRLYLSYNQFKTIPWRDLPPSLVGIDSYYGALNQVDFRGAKLASFKRLVLTGNFLTNFNATELLEVAPNLEEIYLGHNPIPYKNMQRIEQKFIIWNVAVVAAVNPECHGMRDLACLMEKQPELSEGWKLLILLLAMAMLVLFAVFILLLIKKVQD